MAESMPPKSPGSGQGERESTNREQKNMTKGPEDNVKPTEDFGYYFFPDRESKQEKGWINRIFFHGDINNFKCKMNVRACLESSPMVKLMVGALKSYGCPINVNRHISCEPCRDYVSGGFDPKQMQVVVCENNVKRRDVCCNVLAHELLHAFDFCRAKVDFENLRHLACAEIRAANMNHCSLAAALSSGDVSLTNLKKKHEICVKNKALQSIMLVRNVSKLDAMVIVDDVFDKCYNDTEPYGRRCFKDYYTAKRAYDESRNYYDFD